MNFTTRIGFSIFCTGIAAVWTLASSGVARDYAPDQVMYIRAEFSDLGSIYESHTAWHDDLSAANAEAGYFWDYNTYGFVDGFVPTITPVFNLGPKQNYAIDTADGERTNLGLLTQDMKSAAAAAGFDMDSINTFVYSFPDPASINAGALGSPGNIWLPAIPSALGLKHEYGHALGVGHASLYEGGTEVFPGEHREGRDGLYMMGSDRDVILVDGRRAPINLPMRYKIGAVPDELIERDVVTPLIGQTVSETHRIYDFYREDISGDAAAGRNLGVTVDYGGSEWYLSFAPGLAAHWSRQSGSVWASGIAVHEAVGDVTRGLDFTPQSRGGIGDTSDYVDSRDGALTVGNSFTFPTADDIDLTLQPLATGVDSDGVRWIDVQIEKVMPNIAPDPGPQIQLQNPTFAADNWQDELQIITRAAKSTDLTGWVSEGTVVGLYLNVDGDDDPTKDSGPQLRRWGSWQPADGFYQVGFQNSGLEENSIYQDASVFEDGAEYTFSIDLAPGYQSAVQDGFVQILRASDGTLLAETTFAASFTGTSATSTQSISYTATAADLGSRIRVRFGTDSGGSGTSVFANPVLEVMRPILAGDYNDDGVVNLADYTVWRDNLGAPAGTLMNDPNPGTIGVAQYTTWEANFGNSSSPPAAFNAAFVPEPSSMALIGLFLVLTLAIPRRQ